MPAVGSAASADSPRPTVALWCLAGNRCGPAASRRASEDAGAAFLSEQRKEDGRKASAGMCSMQAEKPGMRVKAATSCEIEDEASGSADHNEANEGDREGGHDHL